MRCLIRSLRAALIGLALAAPSAAQTAQPTPPDPYQLTMLIYGALTAVDQANATDNYTVLRDLGAPEFQRRNSPAALAALFANYRKQGVVLAPVVLYQPRLTQPASIDAAGVLHVKGFMPTRPLRIGFDLAFQWVNDAWRLALITLAPSEAA